MFSNAIATQLRSIPRAITRPSTSIPRSAAARSQSIYRSYTATAGEASDAAKTAADTSAEKSDAEKRIAELEAEVKELQREMQYARADIQTMSRRSQEEKNKAADFAITKFAQSLLSTADVLVTALSHVEKPVDPSNAALHQLVSGVELTHKALLNTFKAHGVRKYEKTKGERFDPNLHEATFQVPKEVAPPREDGQKPDHGEIIEVGKEGWMIKDRVLRPAQVGVVQVE